MRLFYSATSPYVRKVMVVAHEKRLSRKIDLRPTDTRAEDQEFWAANPIGKVPALELEGGVVLCDSRVICEYLDEIGSGNSLYPKDAASFRRISLGEGVIDCAIAYMTESRREEAQRSQAWMDRQQDKLTRTLGTLESEVGTLVGAFTMGRITTACALGYIDFRNVVEGWKDKYPRLAAWYSDISERESMRETAPPKG